MAGESVIVKTEYPDLFNTESFVVNINQATGTKEALVAFDKRVVIDSVEVVGLKVGAAKAIRLYAVPVGQDIQGTPGAAATPYVCASVDLNASAWVNADGTSSTATTTATGWASSVVVTTENRLAAGTVLCVEQTGSAAASKNPTVIVRWRERING